LGDPSYDSELRQIYVGLKCISFNFTSETNKADPYTHLSSGDPMKSLIGALMGLAVLWANILSWSLRELVSKGYRQDGELISALHPHRCSPLLSASFEPL
jgi:hypothetical protein